MFTSKDMGLKADEIFSQFPKSTEKLKEFVKKNLVKFYMAMGGNKEELEVEKGINPLVVPGARSTIEVLPRNLYDFFDENNIFIDIMCDTTGDFMSSVDKSNIVRWKTRQEAEKAAFLSAFIVMEDKL